MFPRSPVFPHNRGQASPNNMFTQPSLARAFVQQQIESQLNFTNRNFHSHHLNGFPLIPTYQWKPPLDVPYTSPNGSKTKNRKRKSDGSTQDDQKRQRVRSPKPYEPPGKVSSFSPVHRGEPGPSRRAVDETCSPIRSPMHTPGTSKSVGCVPSLREESYQNAYSGFPPSVVKDKLSRQILDLFLACEQQNEDLQKKESCRAQLQWDIQLLHPCARVFLAGSSLNGFGSRSSDADLCLVVQDGPVNQRTDAVYILSRVQRLLYKLSYIERPQLIRAKVPILKFRDRLSGVEFDLNVNNVVGIRNTFLLRTYAHIERRVRPIILVIKKWASHNKINDASRGTLSSYTLVLMVLHYLQTLPEPVIPCLQKDYPECFSPVMDIHLVPDGPKNIPPFVSKNQSSLGDLLLGFLKYYATVFRKFDPLRKRESPALLTVSQAARLSFQFRDLSDSNRWDKFVISVREGKALPRPNSWEWKNKFICVEEPFDGTNTARAVHEKMKFDAIKAQFTESWQVLQVRKDLDYILPIRETKPKR